MYRNYFKRVFDFIIALFVSIIALPFYILIFVAVKLDSKGPFFYFQDRLGRNGKVFRVFKVRTMTNKFRKVHSEVLKGNPDVTKIGMFLRRFKMDELPQILNVLKGNMSLIGPRPSLPQQIEELNEDGKVRLLVRPGLTGLAQVNGNIYLTWPERWKYDRIYVENLSFLLDVQIIFKTFLVLIDGEEKFLKKPNV